MFALGDKVRGGLRGWGNSCVSATGNSVEGGTAFNLLTRTPLSSAPLSPHLLGLGQHPRPDCQRALHTLVRGGHYVGAERGGRRTERRVRQSVRVHGGAGGGDGGQDRVPRDD